MTSWFGSATNFIWGNGTVKSKVKVRSSKVQRLKLRGNPTQKVVVEFDQEQDMKIALFNGIYFGRIRIRCEPFRPAPSITQCYQCQGFNHLAKDCKSQVKCMRCAGPHKSSECPEKDKNFFNPKCTNCKGDHVAASRICPKFKEQYKIQTEKIKARQDKIQNSLVVRGISFSNIVKTNSDKVESTLTEKIQINKQETKQELNNVALKLEEKLEDSFNQLSGKLVSFMVQSMLSIYDTLDKKNADKVYSILAGEVLVFYLPIRFFCNLAKLIIFTRSSRIPCIFFLEGGYKVHLFKRKKFYPFVCGFRDMNF